MLILIVAACFALMGLVALVSPLQVTRQFDVLALSAAGRSEVRAVYGGFGLAMVGALAWATFAPELRAGLCLAVCLAAWGMAAGRLVSVLVDRAMPPFARLFFVVEVALGAALWWAH
jgi:hypothetical protein